MIDQSVAPSELLHELFGELLRIGSCPGSIGIKSSSPIPRGLALTLGSSYIRSIGISRGTGSLRSLRPCRKFGQIGC